MSEIIGNPSNIHIARMLGVLRVSHLGDETCYDGEDYVNDLNAMHEAEKMIPREKKLDHSCLLDVLTFVDGSDENGRLHWSHDATAQQRAEAFIKTMEESS